MWRKLYWQNCWNVDSSSNEHNNPTKKSKPSKHIKDTVDLVFNWSLLAKARTNLIQQKIQERYYIVSEKPILNE